MLEHDVDSDQWKFKGYPIPGNRSADKIEGTYSLKTGKGQAMMYSKRSWKSA